MVADKNEDFHSLWRGGILLLVNHTVAQVMGVPEEVVGEIVLKEEVIADIKNNFSTSFFPKEI